MSSFLFSVAVFSVLLSLLWLGKYAEETLYLRYLAPGICLLNGLAVVSISRLGEGKRAWGFFGFLVICFFFSRGYIPWGEIASFRERPDFYSQYLKVDGGACKAWMTEHLRDEKVLSIEDDSLYFLPLRNIRVAFHDPEADALFLSEKNTPKLFSSLRRLRFRFVYDTVHAAGNYYYLNSSTLSAWLRRQGSALVFSAGDCVVADLERMELP